MNYALAILSIFVLVVLNQNCGQPGFSFNKSDGNGSEVGDLVLDPPVDVDEGIDDEEALDLVDCSEPDGEKKVLICHVPPGNPEAAHTLCIGEPALEAHLSTHGSPHDSLDLLGACPE